jgi:hypothetical protein
MLPLLTSTVANTQPLLPPDCINESIYLYETATYTPIYNRYHTLLGYKGPISYRPNGNPGLSGEGAIELITVSNKSKLFRATVLYKWTDGIVVKVHEISEY